MLKNRNVREPYEITGVFVVDGWARASVSTSRIRRRKAVPYFNDFRQGNYDAGIDFTCEFMDEPDLYLLKYLQQRQEPDQLFPLQGSDGG